MDITTDDNNIGEILYKTAELRLFNKDRSKRMFQCALAIEGTKVKITLGASFTDSDLSTLRQVKEVLIKAGFEDIEFGRERNGDTTNINLKR